MSSRSGDTNSDNIADPGSVTGIVSVVNGVANTTYRANNVTPVAGQVTFTITSTVAESLIPVVYADANASNSLNLVVPTVANALPKQPSEAFGIGGKTTWIPAAATAGPFTVTPPNVTSVDKTNKYFVADPATGLDSAGVVFVSYTWDSNDNFLINGAPTTMAGFEAQLSTGDGFLTSTFSDVPALVSTFNLDNAAPAAPASLVATDITTTSVVLTVPTPAADVAVRIYQGLSTAATRATAVKVADTTTDADLTLAGFQVNITGLAATTSYEFWASLVQDGDESPLYPASDTGTVVDTSTAPALIVVASAPFASTIAIADNDANNALTSGDAVTITFNEPMAVPAAGATIEFTDGDGTISTVTNGTGSTFTRSGAANQVITVALGAAPSTTAPGGAAGQCGHDRGDRPWRHRCRRRWCSHCRSEGNDRNRGCPHCRNWHRPRCCER